MTAVMFDTLALARKLEEAGFPSHQAQATSAAFAEVLSAEVATTRDLAEATTRLENRLEQLEHRIEALRQDLENQIQALRADMEGQGRDLANQIQAFRTDMQRQARDIEQRLTIRLGGMLAASIAIVAVLVRLL